MEVIWTTRIICSTFTMRILHMEKPTIAYYEPKVDKFILDGPDGERYFRDYEGAEDFDAEFQGRRGFRCLIEDQ